MEEKKFVASKKTGIKNALWVALSAILLTPIVVLIYGFRSPVVIASIAIGSVILVFAYYALRSLLGGIKVIGLSGAGIRLERKKKTVVLGWADVATAKFQNINETPWLTLRTSKKKKHLIALEDYPEAEREEIMDYLFERIPEKTSFSEEWIIANRIRVQGSKKGGVD